MVQANYIRVAQRTNAAVANTGTVVFPYAAGSGFATYNTDWAPFGAVVVNRTNVYKPPQVSIVFSSTQITVTNSSGETWPADTHIEVMAPPPYDAIRIQKITQAAYDALTAKDPAVQYDIVG